MPGFLLFCLWQFHEGRLCARWSKELGIFRNSPERLRSCHQRYVQRCLTLLYIPSIFVAPIMYYFCISPSILNLLVRLLHTISISVFTYWYLYFLADSNYISDLIEYPTTNNYTVQIWCDFDRASSLICGNKMPTRCNRGFYCRSYCLLNMFRAPLCPSSGAQEYYKVVAACGISCCGFQVAGLVWSWGLCDRFAGCCSIDSIRSPLTDKHWRNPTTAIIVKLLQTTARLSRASH